MTWKIHITFGGYKDLEKSINCLLEQSVEHAANEINKVKDYFIEFGDDFSIDTSRTVANHDYLFQLSASLHSDIGPAKYGRIIKMKEGGEWTKLKKFRNLRFLMKLKTQIVTSFLKSYRTRSTGKTTEDQDPWMSCGLAKLPFGWSPMILR